MKAYTDIEQSRKLAEFLPLESADMAYFFMKDDGQLVNLSPFVLDGTEEREDGAFTYLNCWSLAALIKVLPSIEGFKPLIDLDINQIRYEGKYRDELVVNNENLVDACYEMILKLHKLNLL